MPIEDPQIIIPDGKFIPCFFNGVGYVDDETGVLVEDLVYPAHSINPRGAVDGASVSTSYLPGSLLFDDASTEVCVLTVYLTHHYLDGTDLEPHIHWAKGTNGAGDVAWELDYQICRKGEVPDAVVTLQPTGLSASTPDTGLQGQHLETNFPAIPGATLETSDVIIVTLRRLGNDAADTHVGDAHLLQMDFHYQIDPYI